MIRIVVVALALLLAAGCGPTYAPRELPQWRATNNGEAIAEGFTIFPIRTFIDEDFSTSEKHDDIGGLVVYAIVNPEGVGDLDIDTTSARFLTGNGRSLDPGYQVALYRSNHVFIGALAFPPLWPDATRLDLEVGRLLGKNGESVAGEWLVDEVLMPRGRADETALTYGVRMELVNLNGVFNQDAVWIGNDDSERITGKNSPLGSPLVWVADPEVKWVPMTFDDGVLTPEWAKGLENMPR
jgi:hypothetical protein